MSVIAEYTVAAEDFFLGRAASPVTRVELERILEDDESLVPFFWATDRNSDRFERALANQRTVRDLQRVDEMRDRNLYRVRCEPVSDTLAGAVVEFEIDLLSGAGDDETWSFAFRFGETETLSEFQAFVVDQAGINFQLDNIYNPFERIPGIRSELTPRQRETLLTAYEEGYFDIPRKVTLVDLAKTMGVSDQAISERMRRGESKLVRAHLLDDYDEDR